MELDILRALANGMQSKEIANVVDRSTATVESYVRYLCAKFDARSRAQLVALALCDGTISPEDLERPPEASAPRRRRALAVID
jgi:DNA-binding NarL/FixJ family response regulator